MNNFHLPFTLNTLPDQITFVYIILSYIIVCSIIYSYLKIIRNDLGYLDVKVILMTLILSLVSPISLVGFLFLGLASKVSPLLDKKLFIKK